MAVFLGLLGQIQVGSEYQNDNGIVIASERSNPGVGYALDCFARNDDQGFAFFLAEN